MIGCDGTCDDWFHGKCVGIEERDKNLIDKYICPHCTKAGIGRTTWKRICRRSGCRQAARMGKTKNGKDGSKYCSEECGVAYFREMVGRTRGREDMAKHRSSRRKSSIINNERPNLDDDLGARGGVIAAGELKSLVNTSKSAEDFKKLGEGVLSPPSTPDSKSPTASKKEQGLDFTESETKALGEISRQKDDARRKHQLLKDRMKFVTMAKQAASRTATEKELKPKEYCGYDSRIEWTESQFATWRNSKIGKLAFEIETLATESSTKAPTDESEVTAMDLDTDEHLLTAFEICDRKKCARHLEWPKLAVDDVRFEMGDNSDRMRGLDREERELKERVALRGKGASLRGVGRVEVVGLGISLDERAANDENGGMEVDGAV
jgi:COMPASS component SPP1